MIYVTTPARHSCVTIDTHRRLCASCTESDFSPAATQWPCRNCASVWPVPAAKMRHNTGHWSTLQSRSLYIAKAAAVHLLSVHVASVADVSSQQIVTQHMAQP